MEQHEKFPIKSRISPQFDPWDVWQTRQAKGRYELTSIEFTVTNLCNLRCEHCAVGEELVEREGAAIPVEVLIRRLDEIDSLRTISITGGEPIVSPKVVRETIQPLLKYAKSRGIYTQLNSNLTLPLSRYEDWIEDLDVLHISYNYRDVHDFHRIVFAKMDREVDLKTAETLFERMKENSRALAKAGVFVSGESLLSPFTSQFIDQMHHDLVEMGCARHEVHPLYPSDFARHADLISLEQYEEAIHRLLEVRDPNTWILFGTLPFFPCSDDREHRALYKRLHETPSVTVRQDPDGRNRLNVNGFTGDIIVTDFGDVPPLGNIHHDRLSDVFERWLQHPLAKKYHCYCEQAKCTGPNILVANAYYDNWDFTKRSAEGLVKIG
ncbi:radical SAM/CxCxxxxC motif protein YfkAB [Thermoactinomyces sp. DSM 45892]|uniref:radical SAM/CxCxxxxC motif protein YfkAB n=1 Tax=Thermoactinomyces sp. DSM 45892 TaxID=1882753 RepID=UPI0008948A3F|nr:radical SAM/CxCxxxxC motif protein YfkAB [Thermoactinomyces sp. DSM 45892]SDZ28718.1 radical SAM/CxCxxxxC motif protein YfkAB [Thermoactinomyces sp. DSM 45892]